jgi:hypothetical protein
LRDARSARASNPSLADLVVLARSLNPIPSRTRPLNSSAPMVLSLKAWKSRSLPGLPRTDFPHHDDSLTFRPPAMAAVCLWSCPPQIKKAAAGNRGGFCVSEARHPAIRPRYPAGAARARCCSGATHMPRSTSRQPRAYPAPRRRRALRPRRGRT